MSLRTFVLALGCLAYAGHARRMQAVSEPDGMRGSELNSLASLLLASNGNTAFNPSASAASSVVSNKQAHARSGSVSAKTALTRKDIKRLRDMLPRGFRYGIDTASPRYTLETLPSEIKDLIEEEGLLDKDGRPAFPFYGFRSEVDPDLWWGDKDYPSSKVLGIGRNVPSIVFGLSSGVALIVGAWCVAQSNLLNILSGSTVNGWLVLGSLLVPYSWGLHVACWIQKQNGK